MFSGKPRTKDNFIRAFNAYGGFTSGTNVHYPPSPIVNEAQQELACNLVIGERMLPHVFICAADARPFDIQDFLPADTRFKILAFLGDISNEQQRARVQKLAESLGNPKVFFKKFGGEDPSKVFDIVSIGSGRKHEVNYTDVPLALRTHWSKYVQHLGVYCPYLHSHAGSCWTTRTCSRGVAEAATTSMGSIR